MDELKIIIYLTMAAIAFLGNFAGIIAGFLLLKYRVSTLIRGQEKLLQVLYDSDGSLRFQTKDECNNCRKSCRDDICTYIGKEMKRQEDFMQRLEKQFLRVHDRIDDINKHIVAESEIRKKNES